jgi:hypothetical protein
LHSFVLIVDHFRCHKLRRSYPGFQHVVSELFMGPKITYLEYQIPVKEAILELQVSMSYVLVMHIPCAFQ